MLNFSWPEILIVLVIVVILFGVGRIGKIGSELGSGIRGFKESLRGEKTESQVQTGKQEKK